MSRKKLVIGSAIAVALLAAASFSIAQTRRSTEPSIRQAVRGANSAVAAGSDYATDAGMKMMTQNGNAIDVGVTTLFAASVTELSHFGMGGEAPILIRTKEGKVFSIAGVGTMPKLATADMFRKRPLKIGETTFDDDGKGLKGVMPNAGLMPALVPGMVDAGLVALKEFGTKSFSEIIAPAIEHADGYVVDEMRARSFASGVEFFDLWPTSKAHFMPNGHTPRLGEIFRQPDTAATLRSMVEAEKKALASGKDRKAAIDAVRDYFYRGPIARKIDEFSKANGGLLRYEDMAAFHADVEEAVSTTYHGYTVYKPGFWSQGPDLIETLNILDTFKDKLPYNSAAYIHRNVEALKLAYADRDTYYADPKFSKLDYKVFLTKDYAAERAKLITDRASTTFRQGALHGKTLPHPTSANMASYRIDDALMSHDTTCVDVINKDGSMFSATPSGAWMPSVIAGDTGIPLTQRAQSFVLLPGHPNELEGGKRPRVTLSPTLVTTAAGAPAFALSTPGADVQDQALLQVLFNASEYGMDAQQAVEAPRYQTRHMVSSMDNHAWNINSLWLDERIPIEVGQELVKMGHQAAQMSKYNNGSAPVMVRVLANGTIEAGADPFYNRSARAR
ncbi:MAG: gamma-glutamyltransferase [Bryobacteraceae bacterium]